jgi:SAM-dependent methyltransferase
MTQARARSGDRGKARSGDRGKARSGDRGKDGTLALMPEAFRLVACPAAPWDGRVFAVIGKRRHWVPSVEHLAQYGRSLAEVVQVDNEELTSLDHGGPMPRKWDPPLTDSAPATSHDLREWMVSRLFGRGLEFGAGSAPLPLPLDCDVKYADFLPPEEVRARKAKAATPDFVRLDYVMGIEDPYLVPDDSLDFVIASHVIEHVRNPLRALREVHGKLRAGGRLVLIVPDMQRTFDRRRPMTSLAHLILDFESPDPARDREHYIEFFWNVYRIGDRTSRQRKHSRKFFERAYGITAPDIATCIQKAVGLQADAHFHTWTHQSFCRMVEYSQKIAPWSEVWSHPGLPELGEFYFMLQK